jgi:hypothetical protein
MKDTHFPARLHVLIPKNGTTALVIRRGPSKQVCVLAWNTKTDEVAVYQWLKGRIYERRADISPDGKYWIYFAMNGRWTSKVKGSWTAIARAPWLKAISLLSKGDCWHGGGLFTGKRSYWLNDGLGHELLTATSEVMRVPIYEGLEYFGGECPTPYYNRLKRDGWTETKHEDVGNHNCITTFEKPLPRSWTLRKICHEQIGSPKGKGCYWDEHSLISKTGNELKFHNWEWAEWLNGYIVFAKEGCLYRVQIKNQEDLGEEMLVHDFNGYKFEKTEAPY